MLSSTEHNLTKPFHIKLRDTSSPFVRKIIDLISKDNGEVLTEKLWNFIAVIIGNSEGFFSDYEQNEIKENYGYFYKERVNKQKRQSVAPEQPDFRPKTL